MPQLTYNQTARNAAHALVRAVNEKVMHDRVAKTGALAWRIYESWVALKRKHPDFIATYDAGRSRIFIKETPEPNAADIFQVFAGYNMRTRLVGEINDYQKPLVPPVCKTTIEYITFDLNTLATNIFTGNNDTSESQECYDALSIAFTDLKAAHWNVGLVKRQLGNMGNLFEIRAHRNGSRAEPIAVLIRRQGLRDTRNQDFVAIAENLVYEFCHASGTPYYLP